MSWIEPDAGQLLAVLAERGVRVWVDRGDRAAPQGRSLRFDYAALRDAPDWPQLERRLSELRHEVAAYLAAGLPPPTPPMSETEMRAALEEHARFLAENSYADVLAAYPDRCVRCAHELFTAGDEAEHYSSGLCSYCAHAWAKSSAGD